MSGRFVECKPMSKITRIADYSGLLTHTWSISLSNHQLFIKRIVVVAETIKR